MHCLLQIPAAGWVVPILYLTAASIFDIRRRSIPVLLPVILLVLAAGWDLWLFTGSGMGREALPERIMALTPGALLFSAGIITEGKVGSGDGLSLLGIGQFLGAAATFTVLCASLLLCCIFSAVMMTAGRATRHSRVAFLPFLLISCVLVLTAGAV